MALNTYIWIQYVNLEKMVIIGIPRVLWDSVNSFSAFKIVRLAIE